MAQQINLFNPQFRTLPKLFGAKLLALVCGLIIVLALLAWFGGRYQQQHARAQLQDLQASHAKLSAAASQLMSTSNMQLATAMANNLSRVSNVAETRQQLLAHMQSQASSQPFSHYFDGFSQAHVEGVWLTGFSVHDEQLSIDGRALSAAQVPAYIRSLNEQRVFIGRRFAGLQLGTATDTGENQPGGVRFALRNTDKSDAKP
ncbi:PilN domain-containing protein [Chitinimonas naiadis]